ncbi:efflux RND transporter periplasmic adaptor subunit [Rhizobium sp. Root482]|uniref:efflux RND transporter periplasmic adaptor subunit n=1 Tax=Rhizobium sp. Root482 TaxID=1736543 RepID=UPI0006F7ECBB|nr:efflux RND transporter periplasmic adaptor subunit [Rhizobium sp. Root482]KQY15227.1 hemolysin secretion protein D [Rhizobium sp. Root482]
MALPKTPAFCISAAILLFFLPNASFAEEAQAPKPEQALPSIVVTKVENQSITDRVVATGTIKAVEEIYVSPLVDGLSIRSLNADIGDRVEAGAVLATLNEDMLLLQKSQYAASLAKANAALAQYQAQLAEANANAEEAARVSERSKKLSEAGSMSTAQADREEAAATAARARVNSAEQMIAVAEADIQVVEAQIADVDLRLARTEVKTPVSGLVSARTAKIGAIASGAGEPLFTLIRDGAIEMQADIPETDLVRLALGEKVLVTLAGARNELAGKVRLISPRVDAQTRLGTVYIALDEPDKARVGMYADAQIIIEEKQAIVLPLTAVTTANDETIVRKVEDGVVHMAKVTTGIQDGEFIEITTGLKPGDTVVAKAGAYVRDGDKINPVTSASTATN